MSGRSEDNSIVFCISISKVLDEWVSQWQGHLLSCSGQLKTTCVASIHGNEFASALPKYFSEQRGGRLKVLPLYLKSLQYCNLCLLLLTSPHRRSQRSSQVDHLSWWKSSTIFVFFRSLQKSSTIFFVRPWRKSRSTWLKYNFFRPLLMEVRYNFFRQNWQKLCFYNGMCELEEVPQETRRNQIKKVESLIQRCDKLEKVFINPLCSKLS